MLLLELAVWLQKAEGFVIIIQEAVKFLIFQRGGLLPEVLHDEQRIILSNCAKSVEGVIDCKACANAWSLLQEKNLGEPNLECANASYGSSSPCDPENYYPYTDGSEFVNTCSWCSNPGAWTPPVPCNPSGDCENCGDCLFGRLRMYWIFHLGIDLPREAVKAFL